MLQWPVATPPLDPTLYLARMVSSLHQCSLSFLYLFFLSLAMDDDEPSSESNSSTVVYGVIGAGMVLVILALLVVGVLIGKRKRVTAKIWRPKSPSDSSPGEVGGATPTAGSSSADAAL